MLRYYGAISPRHALQHEPDHWELLNTFRTQAQIEHGGAGVCDPEPAG